MADAETQRSSILIALMKGVVWRDDDPNAWESLCNHQSRVRDYVRVLGLELILDENEGYAYLRQRPEPEEGEELPRLVPRRQLSYYVSLLLALLRRKLAESDARAGDTRLVLARSDLLDLMKVFLADTPNEVRLVAKIEAVVQKVVKLGFLRPLKGEGDRYEVRRVLKAFVDAQWLDAFDAKLAEYRAHATKNAADEDEP